MKITIDVPEMKCSRCKGGAPVQPHLIYFTGRVPPQLLHAVSMVMRERSDVNATDSDGRPWKVLADDKPFGWMKGPGDSDLCPACYALWQETNKWFLVPPIVAPPVVIAKPELVAAPVVPKVAPPAQKPRPAHRPVLRMNRTATQPAPPPAAVPTPSKNALAPVTPIKTKRGVALPLIPKKVYGSSVVMLERPPSAPMKRDALPPTRKVFGSSVPFVEKTAAPARR